MPSPLTAAMRRLNAQRAKNHRADLGPPLALSSADLDVLATVGPTDQGSVSSVWQQSKTSSTGNFGGLRFIGEVAEMDLSPVDSHAGRPLASQMTPIHAAMLGGRLPLTGLVLRVSGTHYHAQIVSPVVERITIDVIDQSAVAIREPDYLSVHTDRGLDSVRRSVGSSGVAVTERPEPLARPSSVISVDGGLTTDRTALAAEWDESYITLNPALAALGTLPRLLTGRRTEVPSPDRRWALVQRCAACRARAFHTRRILSGHQEQPPGEPRRVSARPRHSRVNYTPSLQVEVSWRPL